MTSIDSAAAAEVAKLCPSLTDLDLSGNSIDSGNGRVSMHDASDAPEDSLERNNNNNDHFQY